MRPMIFSGVSGWAVTRTPSGARASRTALASAAGDAMAPPSPMPLKPPGAALGVTTWPYSRSGTSAAVGSR